jgi:myosin heavy subunit
VCLQSSQQLGNVNIRGKESDACVQAVIENESQLERAAKMLGVSLETLKKALITKEFGVGEGSQDPLELVKPHQDER